MGDEAITKCLSDIEADLERQGSVSEDDVMRLVAGHRLQPDDVATVLKELIGRGLLVEDAQADEIDEGPQRASLSGESDSLRRYLDQIGKTRLLTAEEEVALGRLVKLGQEAAATGRSFDFERRIAEGIRARDALISANLRLVVSIARRHQNQGLDLADLIQEGTFGLFRAAEKFDYSLGFKFSTYATWWIRQSISRGIADKARLIRLPVHFVEFCNKVRRLLNQAEAWGAEPPTLRDLAFELDADPARVQFAIECLQQPLSLEMEVSDDGLTLGEIVGPSDLDTASDALDSMERAQVLVVLRELERSLADRQGIMRHGATILSRRFGVEEDRIWTLEELGREFGVTRERIRQIESKLLASAKVQTLFKNLNPRWEREVNERRTDT